MTDVWVYRIDVIEVPERAPDLTDFEAYANDGERIGKVDEASQPDRGGFIVVDTGWWIFGKKRMVPIGAIESIDLDERKVHLSRSKDAIKDAPDFDEVLQYKEDYREQVAEHYGGSS